MKKAFMLIIAALICLSACKKVEFSDKLNDSHNKWLTFRNQSNNSYSYTAYTGSVLGNHIETKITVTNGKVTAREYIAGTYKPNTADLVISETWIENESSLNTHTNSGAFKMRTLDQVYTKAKSI
ncbi:MULTISPECIES: hypothetical protein [unclassified Mucilaginibacter]|uniref:hypothetical protein n=1 Tax=unclassified Mucilaginibacter TaxID=2617802 RepID=UPI002AC954C1|nr:MULTISPECIES: hypothetical protein [unclassified Mucilaginibacter]MEB0261836.1 hypothetical protein [Mucilaginibacter sp. 10I4]MEB0278943.1 hypothetical protein [Mucilaginibacter sp. 10B2]MEB0303261.1 hypothetical protein [Mucilaginibacter sp. 5C4]WPX22124.1 hypothetical protein RHM67_12615 [Mucilaginibacter sp. 5C4]